MSDVVKKLRKLKGRGLKELRVRGAQALAARAERAGLSSLARVPTDAAFFRLFDSSRVDSELKNAGDWLEHFRRRVAPRFFAGLCEEEATRSALRTRFNGEAAATIERAERALEGRFDLLGLCDLSFGSPVDWHLEPLTRVRAPLTHWSRIDFLDPKVSGDKKFVWELNRQQFFQTFGRAYWRTGDERFAEGFFRFADAWMDANPPKLGINWASSLEVAFRAISWLWALYFFKGSTRLTPKFFLRLSKLLRLHARHLETYLSTYFSPNTHLTGEALGLFYLGTLLPELGEAPRWRETGRRILLAELERHVRADGVYFEQATYYQRYTADFYMHFALLARENGEGMDARLASKLTALLDHLMHVTRPDGTTPFVGDDDGGRLVMLDERPANDFRAALSNGAALFGRADYKHVAGEVAEETLWLQGAAGLNAFDALDARAPSEGSRAFTDGGYYLMRDGWASDSNYMLLDCGPHGADAIGSGHAHADVLSFDLAARGRTLLVDPGTYTYTGSPEWRDRFRSAAAHNTLTLDGASSSVPGDGAFRWSHVARARTKVWMTDERFDFFEGEHDGYARLSPAPAVVARGVLFLKGDYWIVRDRVKSEGAHACELHLQFAADAAPLVEETDESGAVRERKAGAPGLDVFTFAASGAWRAADGWVSRAYGARVQAPAIVFSAETRGEAEFITLLVPRRASESHVTRAREIEAVGGRAFEVAATAEDAAAAAGDVATIAGGAYDFVLLGDGARQVQTARFSSDFAWTWARCGVDGGEPDELVLIDGRSFGVGGRELLRAERRVGFVVARRTEEGWSARAEAGVRVYVTPGDVTGEGGAGRRTVASDGAGRRVASEVERREDALGCRKDALERREDASEGDEALKSLASIDEG